MFLDGHTNVLITNRVTYTYIFVSMGKGFKDFHKCISKLIFTCCSNDVYKDMISPYLLDLLNWDLDLIVI